MASLQDESSSLRVTIQNSLQEPIYINITPAKVIDAIFTEIGEKYAQVPDEIEITFKADGKEITTLSNLRQKTLYETGLWPIAGVTDFELVITPPKNKNMSLCVSDVSEDELLLGASASPIAGELAISSCEEYPTVQFNCQASNYNQGRRKGTQLSPIIVESPNYVGLVNQAMTCYLNSLLQALYMTPEFRNALYNWEFDGANEARSIPYQLQKLFLNLQTSSKSAVETTDLTTSFGWQGRDAWHQHDIQELCRVMFDALEQKFKDTKQANLINDLYEGTMLDYIKCLECGTEKSREDTFLDIQLPVRPFGSTVAYNSVEEALRAFVQPETLDENNQYFCEKCKKKCDAHKGLKFTKLPYLLTLHLKRFDFDYNTMHRIKLNDKVVFPEKLNLNSFVPVSKIEGDHPLIGDGETNIKCDDCSTTDSGSADDESCQGTDLSSTANGQDDNCGDSDEGIDVSSGNNHHENEAKGPYVYELFSIMIHSGSASGGHYYAYIRDFDKNLWFCFNDQSVSAITEDDIKKTYGDGPQRAYYSGTYSSSTNAYILMYRQIDKNRNCKAMAVKDFPPHIQKLLSNMRQKEEEDRLNRKKEDDMVKINVWCVYPSTKIPQELKISTFSDGTLEEIAQHAYNRFKLDGLVDVKDCRIVSYNKHHKCIDCSFDSDELKFKDVILNYGLCYAEWMLEIREPGSEWRHFKKGGINVRVYPINIEAEDIEEPQVLRLDVGETVGELKEELGLLLNVVPNYLKIVLGSYNEPKYFKEDSEVIEFDSKCFDYRFYVSNIVDKDPDVAKRKVNKFKKLVELYCYVISLSVLLPETDEATLESLSIPSLDFNQNIDKHEQICDRGVNSPSLRASPQLGQGLCGDGYDQSNSEDSSLSDSDRTLIGDAPADSVPLSSHSASPAEQHIASPLDPCQDTYNYDVLGRPGEEMYWDDAEPQTDVQKDSPQNYYFKVTSITANNGPTMQEASNRQCKILVDKRMSLELLKKNLELVLRVPSEYFKVFKRQHLEDEWGRLKDTLRSVKDGKTLTLKLGRVLREDEQQCKRVADALEISLSSVQKLVAKGVETDQDYRVKVRVAHVSAHGAPLYAVHQHSIRTRVYAMYAAGEHVALRTLQKKLLDIDGIKVSLSSLGAGLRKLKFKWRKCVIANRNYLMEQPSIVEKRLIFLREFIKNKYDAYSLRPVVLDETWIFSKGAFRKSWQDQSLKSVRKKSGEGVRYIILHAGCEDGFIENASLIFKSGNKSGDYHDSMNAGNFERWFSEQLLPNLTEPSLIIMDNAPYHCGLVEKIPNQSWTKQSLVEWLQTNNIQYPELLMKDQIWNIVKRHLPEKRYRMDELALENGHRVLRLPPYHCQFNGIEMVRSECARYYDAKITTISPVTNDAVVSLWNEALAQVYHLKPDNMEPNNLLFEHIIKKNQTVESTKKEILHHAKKQNLLDVPYNRCRLREKSWKKPKKVYLDDQKLGDEIVLPYNFELYLQELTEPETVTSNNQVVVFLRKYNPAELTLGPFQEVVLDLLTMDDLRAKVSEISEIPLENLDIANVKGNYPYDMHILEVHSELDWNPKLHSLDQWPLNVEDGCMFFYKDNREALKELTPEEKKEIRQREDARLGRLSVRTYSPGRERALKIYLLDSSPSKLEDDID